MLQYKIPQNVGIEDKIVGPLTLKQLLMIAGGFGISYVLFAVLNKIYELNFIEYAVIALPGLLSVAFALIKINDIPLSKYLFLFMEFAIKPKKRVWDHRGIASIVAPELDEAPVMIVSDLERSMAEKKSKQAANLSELTRMLDSGGFENIKDVRHSDIDETKDDDLVTEAYFGNKRKDSATQNMYWRTKESQKKRLEMLASLPITKLKTGTKESEIAKAQILSAKNEAETNREKKNQTKPAAAVSQIQVKTKPQAQIKTITIKKPEAKQTSEKQITAKPAETPKPQAAKPNPTEPKTVKPIQSAKPAPAPKQATNINPAAKPTPQQNQNPTSLAAKKKRKRNRQNAQPARNAGPVNTINKQQPAKYVSDKPKAEVKQQPKPAEKKPTAPTGKSGEFDFRELQKGEIQINLD